jgi:molecular chaperone GrpE
VSEDLDTAVDPVEGLRQEVGQLRDLFQRRLLEDKAKNALIESVQEQSRAVQDVLRHRQLESVVRESLLAIDRLQGEPATPELAASVAAELLEVFSRRGLTVIDDAGAFDPRVHQVVETVAAGPQLPANSIAAVLRTGYLLDDRLLRPTQVVVATRTDDVGS